MSFVNRGRRAFRNGLVPPRSDLPEKFLFIICMNNSGSTLLERVLSRCHNAVGLPAPGGPDHQVNGQRFVKQYMPNPRQLRCRRIWSEQAGILQDESRYQWPLIKERWRQEWARNPKFHTATPRVLLEKSPPNVYRASMLQKHFENSFFILMQRNPYAVAEGIRRRAKLPIERCIQHWIRCAQQQMRNEKVLHRTIKLKYEELSECPEICRQRIVGVLPELKDLDIGQDVAVHSVEGRVRQTIVNFNRKQIALLSEQDLAEINRHLDQVPEVMGHFGYQYLRPGQSRQAPRSPPESH
jgi:Sulfotransferase family